VKLIKVKDIMIPLSEYATAPEDATLHEVIMALEKAQKEFDKTKDRHRAVLVYDKHHRIVGKISQLDVLRALEPNYTEIGHPESLSRFGFSLKFLRSILEHNYLWDKPLNNICRKAAELKASTFMYSISEGEYVEANTPLDEAIHQLVVGHHQSLLVTRGNDIVGVLRICDVFRVICQMIKATEDL
jgi:CBS domain-containing protein